MTAYLLPASSDVAEILRRADFSLNGDSPGAMSAPGAALISEDGVKGLLGWGVIKGGGKGI